MIRNDKTNNILQMNGQIYRLYQLEGPKLLKNRKLKSEIVLRNKTAKNCMHFRCYEIILNDKTKNISTMNEQI